MSRHHRDHVLEHPSLIQSGVVQARLARPPRPVAATARVMARSFDDGRSIMAPGRGPVEYDCSAANPALNPEAYSAATQAALPHGDSCDVAAANPSFDPTPYQDGHDAPAAPAPAAAPAEPDTRQDAAPRPSGRNPTPPEAATKHGNPFSAREIRSLVEDDDFRADLNAILARAPEPKREPARQPTPEPAPKRRQAAPPPTAQAAEDVAASLTQPSEHAIFDRIAQNMRYATAYELAPVSLSRRFDNFDRQGPRRPPTARPAAMSSMASGAQTVPASSATPPPIAPVTPPVAPPANPVLSATLRPHSEAERIAIYGDPRPDPEAWAAENVVEVQIPQLADVSKGDGAASDGKAAFHKLGARSLADLFAAWELAGVMSRVLTFDATRATEPPHDGGDAHAWAIAFDINAKWNPAGSEPAGIGERGSVHELVEIANRYGFVWGGHDPRRKAGLHFELGQRI